MFNYILILLIVAFAAIKIIIKLLTKYNVVDKISADKFHKNPTVRGAGIIFLIPLAILMFTMNNIVQEYDLDDANVTIIYSYIKIFMLIFISTILFFLEDIKSWSRYYRFIYLLMIGLIFTYLNKIEIDAVVNNVEFFASMPKIALYSIVTIAYTWFFNIYNFMDGIDLITAKQTIFTYIAVTIFILIKIVRPNLYINELNNIMVLKIISVFIPFLIMFALHNKPPQTKCFLGDSGSICLGMTSAIIFTKAVPTVGIMPIFIVSMYYIFDATISLFIRFFKKENIFNPNHSAFFYQKPRLKEKSCHYVTNFIFLLNMFLLTIATLLILKKINVIIASSISIVATLSLLIHFHAHQKKCENNT
jgi:UDP-N-acetylmuramyl pentapeptide phosphotransferase/UDP-N-acetylglucosamine-1-phosphate transferase